jgi:hypothetical protein
LLILVTVMGWQLPTYLVFLKPTYLRDRLAIANSHLIL